MAQDLFSTLRSYASKVSSGEKSAAEVSAAFAAWAKESGEGIKDKVEEEIESALLKMGFIRKSDLAPLVKIIGKKPVATKTNPKKIIKRPVKKAAVSKSAKGK